LLSKIIIAKEKRQRRRERDRKKGPGEEISKLPLPHHWLFSLFVF
jgi:hypothetical protein